MTKIATPHFDFESKKEYMKPAMQVIQLQSNTQLLAGSKDAYGMNKSLQTQEEVDDAW